MPDARVARAGWRVLQVKRYRSPRSPLAVNHLHGRKGGGISPACIRKRIILTPQHASGGEHDAAFPLRTQRKAAA